MLNKSFESIALLYIETFKQLQTIVQIFFLLVSLLIPRITLDGHLSYELNCRYKKNNGNKWQVGIAAMGKSHLVNGSIWQKDYQACCYSNNKNELGLLEEFNNFTKKPENAPLLAVGMNQASRLGFQRGAAPLWSRVG